MSEPLHASPLLSELQRLLAAQHAIAFMPTLPLDMSIEPIAIVDFQQQIGELAVEATDEDLIKAYREIDGERGGLDAEVLLAEIARRNIDI
jgi:hypothetical protein